MTRTQSFLGLRSTQRRLPELGRSNGRSAPTPLTNIVLCSQHLLRRVPGRPLAHSPGVGPSHVSFACLCMSSSLFPSELGWVLLASVLFPSPFIPQRPLHRAPWSVHLVPNPSFFPCMPFAAHSRSPTSRCFRRSTNSDSQGMFVQQQAHLGRCAASMYPVLLALSVATKHATTLTPHAKPFVGKRTLSCHVPWPLRQIGRHGEVICFFVICLLVPTRKTRVRSLR